MLHIGCPKADFYHTKMHANVSLCTAVRDEIKFITIPRSSTLDLVIDLLKDEFEHEGNASWTIYHVNSSLTEEEYLDLKQKKSQGNHRRY